MRHLTRIASAEDVAVDDLRIVERTRAWTAPEHTPGHQLVFVWRGAFGLRLRRAETTADPVSAFVGRPGDEQSIAHRPGREDVCTVVSLGPRLAAEVLPWRPPTTLRTSGRVDMAHRALLARARQGADGFELSERVVRLAEALLRDPARTPARDGTPSHRRLADGHRDLAGLAADLGFADHAHLTRAMRAEVGDPPSQVRRFLAGEHESSSRARQRRGRSRHDRSSLERPHVR